jgi:hypothetical protein
MTKQIFTAQAPDAGEAASISTTRALEWATWGYSDRDRAWIHLGWSVQTDKAKAEASARSTGPYFQRWMATPVAVFDTAAALAIDEHRRSVEWSSGAAVWGER